MSQSDIKNNVDKFLFKWSNLTSLGVPSSTVGAILDNERVYKHSPRRFNFYMQVMESIANPNPKILETVIKKENQTRYQREEIDEKIKNIVQYFQRPEAKMDPNLLQTIKGKLSGNILTRNIQITDKTPRLAINEQELEVELKKYVSTFIGPAPPPPPATLPPPEFKIVPGDKIRSTIEKLKKFLLDKEVGDGYVDYIFWDRVSKALNYPTEETLNSVLDAAQNASQFYNEEDKKSKSTSSDPRPDILQKAKAEDVKKWFDAQAEFWRKRNPSSTTGGAREEMSGGTLISDMSNMLFNKTEENVTDTFKSLSETTTPTAKQVINTYKNDPYLSPDNEKVAWADRAIFIGLTYIVRALALFLTEWSIYSGYINKFTDAFAMYFGMYTCIFLLVVFLTNARKDDMVFRMVFFYMNSQSEDGKGVWRIIVHLICILMLLPIPYVVKEYREFDQPSVLSFADKATILSGVEKFSLYTWILTSVVALNV